MRNEPILWLKDERKKKKLSTYKVANMAGISQSHYSMIENGSRSARAQTAKKIAGVLGFEWTRFFEEENAPQERGGR